MSHDEASGKPSERKSKVIVGCQCGTAVLRGAHVFAPGVLAAPAGVIFYINYYSNIEKVTY